MHVTPCLRALDRGRGTLDTHRSTSPAPAPLYSVNWRHVACVALVRDGGAVQFCPHLTTNLIIGTDLICISRPVIQLVVLSALVAVASAGYLGAPAVVAPGAPVSAYGYGAPALAARPLAYAAAPALAARPLAYAAAPALAARPLAYAAAPALAARPLAYAAAPAVAKVAVDTDFDPNPSYSYAYDIQDALTGDSKGQQESRQGDVVQGSYSLTEPDGTRRTVEYTADPVNGFNAVVHKTPLAAPVAKVAVAAPVAYAAPAVAKVAAPLGYASPLGYAAPIHSKAIIG
uniref:Uncharacterized protein n=1 Tax=Timema tahoe TaxID=61484 RepID=A0A7R9NVX4_9NEOP|nr:unnamed protein product [Timema tahoe]